MQMRHPILALGLALAILAAVKAQAAGSLPPYAQRAGDLTAACESARLSAWFERQREITDGDVDPNKAIALSAQCAAMSAAAAPTAEPAVARGGDSRDGRDNLAGGSPRPKGTL